MEKKHYNAEKQQTWRYERGDRVTKNEMKPSLGSQETKHNMLEASFLQGLSSHEI